MANGCLAAHDTEQTKKDKARRLDELKGKGIDSVAIVEADSLEDAERGGRVPARDARFCDSPAQICSFSGS
jgi:hypothetical protein